jgi:hypothetical protein
VASLKAGQMEVSYYEVAPHILIGAFLYSHDWRPALLCALAALFPLFLWARKSPDYASPLSWMVLISMERVHTTNHKKP